MRLPIKVNLIIIDLQNQNSIIAIINIISLDFDLYFRFIFRLNHSFKLFFVFAFLFFFIFFSPFCCL
jgi:hypothetical protein